MLNNKGLIFPDKQLTRHQLVILLSCPSGKWFIPGELPDHLCMRESTCKKLADRGYLETKQEKNNAINTVMIMYRKIK